MSDELRALARIGDPEFYVGDPHPILHRLRAEAPVLFLPDLNVHVLTRWNDIRNVGRSPDVFSSANGMLLNDAKYGGGVAHSFFPEGAELITATDPPRHRELRRVISPSFASPVIARMEPFIRTCARELIERLEPDREIDFVADVAVPLPIYVISALLGLDGASVDELRDWSDQMVRMGGDLTADELDEIAHQMAPLNEFLLAQLDRKRGHEGSDLISTLLAAEIDNERVTDLNILMLTTATLVAGNETTRNLMSNMIATLAQHPDELRRVDEERQLSGTAVDEVLRFTSPVAGFIRTATTDTQIGDVPIKRGEVVYLLYMAGNRDGDVFPDPDRFDVGRPTHPAHVAFGYGEHVCPGASLTRLEARVLLEELLDRFSGWQVGDGRTPIMSVMSNGYTSLPTTFEARVAKAVR